MEDIMDAKTFNKMFLDSIDNANNGPLVKASSAGTQTLRTQLREEGFFRKIIPMTPITNGELDRSLDHDRPVKILDKEPNSKGAVTLPFNASSEMQEFYGPKYLVDFFIIKTPKFRKSIHELRTYTQDLRNVITENMLKDIQTEEDANFIDLCDTIVGTPNTADSVIGLIQNHNIAGGLTRNTYPTALTYLEKNRLNNGVTLMNRTTAKEFLKFDRAEIGGDLSEGMFKDGLKALTEAKIFGVPHIWTIKDELVPDNTIYAFTEPNFLGRSYSLQDVTMYVERKEDQITFCASECIGFSIGNVVGVQKINFV
jgi:hypothetical protein